MKCFDLVGKKPAKDTKTEDEMFILLLGNAYMNESLPLTLYVFSAQFIIYVVI